jgi:hypothetical protein
MFGDQLKSIIYWVGLGASLIVYAHANFSTKEAVLKVEKKIEGQASKEDILRLENKVEKIYDHLLRTK